MKKNKIIKSILTCAISISMLTLVLALPIMSEDTVTSVQGLGSELVRAF